MKDTVKVELRQENRDRKAGKVPAVLEIRAPEDILDVASDYEVSLLKFVTGFDVPILHIPEDKPLLFGTYHSKYHLINFKQGFSHHGIFKDVKDFCRQFNLNARTLSYRNPDGVTFTRYKPFTLDYDETINKLILIYEDAPYPSRLDINLHLDERSVAFFRNFNVEPISPPDATGGTYRVVIPNEYRVLGVHRIEANTNDLSVFYNFDYIQLGTDLPIAKTLTTTYGVTIGADTTSGAKAAGLDSVYKMPTLGTVAANAMVQDAYAKGGLLYLPNFKVTSSLRSDLPLKNFKIAPHIFYKTGHYEQVVLAPGSTCYALVEFSPR